MTDGRYKITFETVNLVRFNICLVGDEYQLRQLATAISGWNYF